MLSFSNGDEYIPLVNIKSENKKYNKKVVYFTENDDLDENDMIKTFKELILQKNDRFSLLPSDKTRSIYITGSQGIGKSYWAGEYLKEYQKVHKQSKIIIFSEKKFDSVFDDALKNIKRIDLNDLLQNPINDEEIANLEPYTMFLMDDVDCIKNKNIKKEVYNLVDRIIAVERSRKINIIFTSHVACNSKETKIALTNSDIIVFFPKHYNASLEYLLKNYIGLRGDDLKKFENKQYKSRWTAYIKTYPPILLFENQIKIL